MLVARVRARALRWGLHFLPRDRLSWKLGLIVAVMVIGGLGSTLLFGYREYRQHYMETARNHAAREADLVRVALEHQMLAKDRVLVGRMVQSFRLREGVERVMLLNREGVVKYASEAADEGRQFAQTDPSCKGCHENGTPTNTSLLVELPDEEILRSVQPLRNGPTCHKCHDPSYRTNGLVIVDVDVGKALAGLESSMERLALAAAAAAMLLVLGIGLAIRRIVLDRIRGVEETASAIAAGDLKRRVPVRGNDRLSRVQESFNDMADSVANLLGRVQIQRVSLERIMNSVDDGLVVLDQQMRVVAANGAFARRFERSVASIVGQSCRTSVCTLSASDSCGEGDGCPARLCFDSGQVSTSILGRQSAQEVRLEEIRASPIVGDDGKITHVVEAWRDITDRRRAEARLAETERLASLGLLASGVSHELNTPIGSVAACLRAIRRIEEPTGERLELLNIAEGELERCGGITRRFLDLARGASSGWELIELGATAEQVVRLAMPTANEAGIEVMVHPPPEPIQALAGSAAFSQVLLNLVLNAVQSCERGGKVDLRFTLGDPVLVTVEDDGRGVARADQDRIFDPFVTFRDGGTGLGLFVSRNMARSWGGRVVLVRSEPSVGTVFAVEVPRPDLGEESKESEDGPAEAAAG